MEEIKLSAKKRDLQGSSNARRMRRDGWLPGVIYGGADAPSAVAIGLHEFEVMLHHHASESMVFSLDVEGSEVSVLLKEVQRHPVTGDLLHFDLQKMEADTAIRVEVTLELVGESAGVKEGGNLEHVMHSVEIECLPADLPETLEVDVSEMVIGDVLHVSDLKVADSLRILADVDAIVASVTAPKAEEEEADDEAAPSSEEPEVITEKKPEA